MKTGYIVSAMLFLALITVAAGVFRLGLVSTAIDTGQVPPTVMNQRYVEHPTLTFWHIMPGSVFLLLAPLQFIGGIRARWPAVHRWIGRMCILAGGTAAITAIDAAIVFPAFGGWITALSSDVFGSYVIVALVIAWRAIRRRDIATHRQWMIRAVTVTLGVTTIRIFFGLALVFLGIDIPQSFAPSFILGFAFNAVVAELILRPRRKRDLKSIA